WLTEPNQLAVFDHGDPLAADDEEHALPTHWVLDRRTRMLYRGTQLFINGEVAPVRAEPGLRELADGRELAADGTAARKLSQGATDALAEWVDAGWIHAIRRQSL
ncbi:MAG: winged helix domain-containing protein, partial [Burkholderiales bacterium]